MLFHKIPAFYYWVLKGHDTPVMYKNDVALIDAQDRSLWVWDMKEEDFFRHHKREHP